MPDTNVGIGLGGARGIHRVREMPDAGLGRVWDSIRCDPKLKERLVAHAVLNFTTRARVPRSVLPVHGLILLVGEPGTGKTSLARGLANQAAKAFPKSAFRLVEVDPHQLGSSAMGRTQKAVSELFAQAIPEAALGGPAVVLLDEVETLAVDRGRLSMDANPVDIHRATDAVLVQLDLLAESNPNLLFVATSNFPQALDGAFTSRCDLVAHVPLPDGDACQDILVDCLTGLAETFPKVGRLLEADGFGELGAACAGLDGRTVRKSVASALGSDLKVAADPNRLTVDGLRAEILSAKAARLAVGSCP